MAASPAFKISSPLTHKKGLILRLHPLEYTYLLSYLPTPLFAGNWIQFFLFKPIFCSRYHTGSLAFGSLIIAIVQLIRAGLEYLDHKLNGGNITLRLRKASYFSFESQFYLASVDLREEGRLFAVYITLFSLVSYWLAGVTETYIAQGDRQCWSQRGRVLWGTRGRVRGREVGDGKVVIVPLSSRFCGLDLLFGRLCTQLNCFGIAGYIDLHVWFLSTGPPGQQSQIAKYLVK